MLFSGIRFFPLMEEAFGYQWRLFFKDFFAAISVALLALPQAMAYAFVAGLPPQVGIFSAIFGTLFSSAFGESRYLITGPTTQNAILLQSGLSEILLNYYPQLMGAQRDEKALSILMQLVLLVAILQLAAGLLRLGRLTQFTSRSVIAGYSVGIASAILITQLYPFFGIAPPADYVPLYLKALFFLQHLTMTHWPTLIVSCCCLVIFIFANRLPKYVPVALIVFALSAWVIYALRLSPEEGVSIADAHLGQSVSKITLLGDIGPLYTDLPKLKFPMLEFKIVGELLPVAFAIALLSVIQAAAIGRSYARMQDPPYNDNQEIYGLGISNLFCALTGAMPSGGNFSRSALNYTSGAKTRFAGIYSALILFLLVMFLGDFVTKIPLAALSALMILTACQLLSVRELNLCLRATSSDTFVVLMTWAACLIFTFDMALYVGVAVSIVLYLKQAAVPHVVEYAFTNIGKLRPLDEEDERPDGRIAIFQLEGDLFFGAADLLQNKLRLIGEDENIKVLILQLLNVRHIDASVCLAFKYLNSYLQKTGRLLMLAGVSEEVYQVLENADLISKIGQEAIFFLNEQLPGEATRAAYAQAKKLLSADGI